jgi:hypothetical protein
MEKVSIFMAVLSVLRPNGIFCGHLVHFVVIWYIISPFGMLYRKNLATLIESTFSKRSEDIKIRRNVFFKLIISSD